MYTKEEMKVLNRIAKDLEGSDGKGKRSIGGTSPSKLDCAMLFLL